MERRILPTASAEGGIRNTADNHERQPHRRLRRPCSDNRLLLKGALIRALLVRINAAPILLGLFVLVGGTARSGQVLVYFSSPIPGRKV